MSGPSYADPQTYARLSGFGGDWRDTWWNADFLDLLGTRFSLSGRARLLDVGCGAGHWGRAVLPRLGDGAALDGIDHEAAFIEAATAAAREAGLEATYRVASADALPFEDNTFDVTTCQTVLIHVTDAQAVVDEMVRVTKPGGVVLLVEPDNATMAVSFANTSVPLTPDEQVALFRLQVTCLAGKRTLGEGDGMVGAHLPQRLHAAGTQNIRAFTSDKCAAAVPPYDVPAQAIDLKTQLDFAAMEMWMPTGTREDSQRHFLAGGGTQADFDTCWSIVRRWFRTFEQQVAAGTFHTARPVSMVVAAGQVT